MFPATSVAVTVNAVSPRVAVSSAAPSATVPTHDASPEPPASAHEKSATTESPCVYDAPTGGVVNVTVGSVSSGGATTT